MVGVRRVRFFVLRVVTIFIVEFNGPEQNPYINLFCENCFLKFIEIFFFHIMLNEICRHLK